MNKLLIVEDEKVIRQGIKVMVMRSGVPIHEIIDCRNGLEALEIVKNQEIDVMITDIRMPKMDGITLVKEIQKMAVKPKVIVVSGYDDFSYAVELLRNGAREYLLKPVEREKITSILEKLQKEIEEEEHQKVNKVKLARKQLKYFLLDKTDDAPYEVEEEMSCLLEEQNYFVICVNCKGYKSFLGSIVDIENIEEQEIFIITENQKSEFITQVLKDAVYGESKRHRGINELRQAYKEAIMARKEAFLKKKKTTIECDQNNKKMDEVIERLVQLIGTDKVEESIKAIRIFQYKIEEGKVSVQEFESFVQRLMGKIEETYQNIIDRESDSLKDLKIIYRFDSQIEYFEALIQWLKELHETIEKEFNDYKNKQKIQKAITYIHENYSKDLNMAVVSNYISMNYSLFSVVFKQYTGMNFVNYLKKIRFDEAKRLLTSTDKKIIEISEMIGYENEKHFMKVFKSNFGVSPTEYRKNTQIGCREN
ncbi:MAG: response regulator [Cellulosilyticum sp.]|nr:response regulator [Cellulosilyticum sp.]